MSQAFWIAKQVMLDHQVRWDGQCFCGWDRWGESYAEHVLEKLQEAGIRFSLEIDLTDYSMEDSPGRSKF